LLYPDEFTLQNYNIFLIRTNILQIFIERGRLRMSIDVAHIMSIDVQHQPRVHLTKLKTALAVAALQLKNRATACGFSEIIRIFVA
jgi:hypothetical protein